MKTLLEQLAEVCVRVIHGMGCIFHGELFGVVVGDICGDIPADQGNPDTLRVIRQILGRCIRCRVGFLDYTPDGTDQGSFIIGLENIVHGPQGNGLPGIGKAVEIADKENGAVPVCLPDHPGHFQAGAAGHFNIEDHNAGIFLMVQMQRFDTILCR